MTDYKLPWYAKISIILLGLSLLVALLFFGRDVFIPLAYTALLSVVLTAFVEKHKFPRLASMSIGITLACIVFGCFRLSSFECWNHIHLRLTRSYPIARGGSTRIFPFF